MNIIFISPFKPLWTNDVSALASLMDSKVVYIGDLLREEVTSNSKLGKEIKSVMENGEILKLALVSELLAQRFFGDSTNKILVGYPRNRVQAESIAELIKNSSYILNACIVVNSDKESITEKFASQYHCSDYSHPNLETLECDPVCETCHKPMLHSYDLKNDKVAHLIDSYFEMNGVLSGVSALSSILGMEAITYTDPKVVADQVLGYTHKNV